MVNVVAILLAMNLLEHVPVRTTCDCRKLYWISFLEMLVNCSTSFVLFLCLFGVFFSNSRVYHSFGDVAITGKGLHISMFARHLWPLNSEGSLLGNNYCGKGHSFKMGIPEVLWHSHWQEFWQLRCHYPFYRLSGWDSNIQHPTCWANTLSNCATDAVHADRCVCLILCLVFCSLENCSIIWRLLPVKGYTFWPLLGTHGHWAVMCL